MSQPVSAFGAAAQGGSVSGPANTVPRRLLGADITYGAVLCCAA